MIEIPEAKHIARQIKDNLGGKIIASSQAASSPHKFAWYQGDSQGYPALLNSRKIQSARAVGGMVEIQLEGARIVLSEGAYPRLYSQNKNPPVKHQLLLEFSDESFLAVSVRMYGGILAFEDGQEANEYYLLAREKPSPLTPEFDRTYFDALLQVEGMEKRSAKAFLATEQRIPGLGNGTLQDILFFAGIHPKRKISDIDQVGRIDLFESITKTLSQMAKKGGRDTEMDLFGQPGVYQTRCSKRSVGQPCQQCGALIEKSSYMGGSIYYCCSCQPL